MADEELDSGLFNISLASDTEDGDDHQNTSTSQKDRTGQTEEQFQAVKRSYRAKIENGEVSYKSLLLLLLLLLPCPYTQPARKRKKKKKGAVTTFQLRKTTKIDMEIYTTAPRHA